MRFTWVAILVSGLAAGAWAEHTNVATAGTSPVFTASTPNAVLLSEKAMKETERLSRSRTRDSQPGAAHEVSLAIEAGRNESRAEETRSGAAPTNQPVSASGAKTARDIATPAAVPLTPAQREAQRATERRKDIPVKTGE
jgi:hypothetical protein